MKIEPPEGMGDEVINIQPKDLYRLGEIPREVEIIGVLPFIERRYPGDPLRELGEKYPEWIPHPIKERDVFIHIRHKLCMRCPPGCVMMVDSLDNFLKRFSELKEHYG